MILLRESIISTNRYFLIKNSYLPVNDLDKYIAEKKAESERNQILEKDDSINIEDFKSDVPGYPYSKDGRLFKSKKEFKDFLDSEK